MAYRDHPTAVSSALLRGKAKNLRRHTLRMASRLARATSARGSASPTSSPSCTFPLRYDARDQEWPEGPFRPVDGPLLDRALGGPGRGGRDPDGGARQVRRRRQPSADGRLDDPTPASRSPGARSGRASASDWVSPWASGWTGRPARVFASCRTGSSQEGAMWEAAMAAAHFALDRLIVFIDCNDIAGGRWHRPEHGSRLPRSGAPSAGTTGVMDGNDMEAIACALRASASATVGPRRSSCDTLLGRACRLLSGGRRTISCEWSRTSGSSSARTGGRQWR